MRKNQKTAIIVVTYNRADVTCLMLESLCTAKNETASEVILIDNKSKSEELGLIKNTFSRLVGEKRIVGTFIENEANKGFSGGNNVGLKIAFDRLEFTHICLLNNDTIVSDFWLDNLIGHNVNGLVGPVSNNVGNEQIIPLLYEIESTSMSTLRNVFEFGSNWTQLHKGNIVSTPMLGFFCVLGPTQVFQKIGLLDEEFGLGMFEDDDYCVRALQGSFEIKIARDVFVHHWGSASFSRLKKKTLSDLMAKNRAYYERKHNVVWQTYVTTLVDGMLAEHDWNYRHPSALSQRACGGYEIMLKSYLKGLYLQADEIQNLSFWALIAWGIRKNSRLNIYVQGILLIPVYFFMGIFGDRNGFSRLVNLFRQAGLRIQQG
ncbi:MAG: glycosyltransferase family 2 protein [Bdellovibrionales bacterium]|nr:glycosyltransferase family 2 protein [Bdellovibrionales bacterium]